ncbi:MAG: EamA family transporter, partial [Candidatus Nanopelagicaceae bacterium]|nr:EamA family transporter [Candidatus Nanopelagicaceae bacterium]
MSNLRTRNASLVLAGVCFGTTGTAQALGPKGVSPLAVGSARLIIGALLLYIFHIAIREASSRISRQDLIL